MTSEIRDERFKQVVGDSLEIKKLGSGFAFTEGPVWNHIEKHLTFSDIPGDEMHRRTPDGKIASFRKPSHKANGHAYDRKGRIVTCEHATSRVTRTEPDGSITVLASHYEGTALNSPNDIVVRSDGVIYFTDPTYGRMEGFGVLRDQELDFQGVYRVEEDGSGLALLSNDFAQPNGVCFSADETQLFVNDTERGHIRRFDINGAGTVTGGDVWTEVTGEGEGAPDGLKVDIDGNVYCCGPGGLHVFAPDGTCLGVIKVPEVTANFTWGDDDMKSIYLTASTSLYCVRSNTPGAVLF